MKNHDTLFNVWGLENTVKKGTGLVFNFYGPPGTGKSITAEAIAKEIGRAVMLVNYPNLESKYVGETPKNIQKVFADAKQRDAVLFSMKPIHSGQAPDVRNRRRTMVNVTRHDVHKSRSITEL